MPPSNEELYDKAKQLVGEDRIDAEIDKNKRSGQCLTTHQALNAIIRENSREVIGTEVIKGFMLGSFESERATLIHVLSENGVNTMFVDSKLAKHFKMPKIFATVKVKANKIRNTLTDTESMSLIKLKSTNSLKREDCIPWFQKISSIGDKVGGRDASFLIPAKVRGVFDISFEKNVKLDKPKPIYEKLPDQTRVINLSLKLADLDDDNVTCSMKVKTLEHLAAVLGASEKKSISVAKIIPMLKGDNQEVIGRLRDALIGQELLLFGSGSDVSPDKNNPVKLKNPYFSIGNSGFIMSYRHFVGNGVTSEVEDTGKSEDEEESEEEEETEEVEKPKKKVKKEAEVPPSKVKGKKGQATLDHLTGGSDKDEKKPKQKVDKKTVKAEGILRQLIKEKNSDKVAIRKAMTKAGVLDAAKELIADWMQTGKLKQRGEKLVLA